MQEETKSKLVEKLKAWFQSASLTSTKDKLIWLTKTRHFTISKHQLYLKEDPKLTCDNLLKQQLRAIMIYIYMYQKLTGL